MKTQRPSTFAIPTECEGLSRIALSDFTLFDEAARAGGRRGWTHYFPYLFFVGRTGSRRILFERHSGAVLVYLLSRRQDGMRLDLVPAPYPFDAAALRHAEERMRSVNRTRTTRIRYADEQDALMLARHGYRIQHVGDEFLFDRAAVEALEGSAYRRLRKELGKTERRPSLLIRPYEDSDQAACIGLLDDWARRLKARGIGANGYNYTKACLREAGTLPAGVLQGEVFEVGGQVAAFGFSGPITSEVGCGFISINRTDIRGLTYLVRWRNITRLTGARLVNASTDNGREGLNSIKQSFRPVGMHGIFSGRST